MNINMARTGATKLSKLRELMAAVEFEGAVKKGIQALIVGSEDAHLSEYITDRDKRRQFISGFQGSLGTAIITDKDAMMWTDGRYYAQAQAEFDPPDAWTLMKEGTIGTPTQDEWLVSNLPPNSTVGADPNLMSYAVWIPLHNSLSAAGHNLLPLEENLIDKLWGDEQPPVISNPIVPQLITFTGKTAGEKITQCREAMKKNRASVLVITTLDEVAYLLNLRGSDIPYNPVFFAYVIITLTDIHIFVDKTRLTAEAEKQLNDEGVEAIYHPYEDVRSYLKQLALSNLFITGNGSENERIWINSNANYALHTECGDVQRHIAITPVRLMQVIKNQVEIDNMKAAHIRDSAALVKYFAWLEDKVKSKCDPPITEITGADKLEQIRREQKNFVGLSFPTISSVGPHGAVIHYLPSPKTDVPITDQEIYLCDSGAQYYDGTTDVTRTFHFGTPTSFQREAFTRVFKGQTAVATAVFPMMIKGNYLDILARKSLWDVGLHYLHGSGHGVGAYLNVHEFPTAISWRPYPDDPGLQPGIFLSNEPGFYEDGSFGIRLENVQFVIKANTPYNHRNLDFLTFETVTFVPIQTSLLDIDLLTDQEIEYLNSYHAKCLEILRPFLQGEDDIQARQWLEKETLPISR
ncbi:xaa-Pro aminopeptidase ApepP [Microplitis demolitor]|uniref:xaa-Pro aminopeptidase ApepP n=1 Tax=Microplitis demolitor TaxID=69319 RepID=UPI00044002A0|nr:xaa-Pro aminopeptidase ApepP [Microplitis demolitor]